MQKKTPIIFGICLLSYFGFFGLDQHLRSRKGPWSITFTNESSGDAAIIISQEYLGIRDIKVVLEGERTTNAPITVAFDRPGAEPGFGKLLFLDTTYLPGTVTLDLFGHAMEVLPRTLRLDNLEYSWTSNPVVRLRASDKIYIKAPVSKKGLPTAK